MKIILRILEVVLGGLFFYAGLEKFLHPYEFADAVLAYKTDTLAEAEKLHVIPIDSPLAAAVQPFSIARSSDFKYLGRRLFATIQRSPEAFTSTFDMPAFNKNCAASENATQRIAKANVVINRHQSRGNEPRSSLPP